jgi:ribosomal protein S6
MEKDNKKEFYEIAFWTKEENNDAAEKLISKHGAAVERKRISPKMKLFFPIKKENFAFLDTIVFSAEPEMIAPITADLNLETGILRYFLRKARKSAPESRSESAEGVGPDERKPFFRIREERKGPENILTNEAIEKKIEEILK